MAIGAVIGVVLGKNPHHGFEFAAGVDLQSTLVAELQLFLRRGSGETFVDGTWCRSDLDNVDFIDIGAITGSQPQLAQLVPTFDPAKDDVLVYGQKVQLLLAAWPPGKYTELGTRLILGLFRQCLLEVATA